MRLITRILVLCAAIAVSAPAAPAATYTVTDTGDMGMGTLRQAILDANANVNVVDLIEFNIAGPPFTIQPASALPTITDPVTIDGYTQPGTSVNTDPRATNAVLLIEIDGSMAGAANGFQVEHVTNLGAGTTIRGLVINNFNTMFFAAIRINDDGNNVIEGNFIGTDPSGLVAEPNYDGIATEFFAAGNQIGGTVPAARNLISGNSNRGIVLDTDDNVIEGNLIGTDRTGVVALANAAGIVLFNFAHDNTIGGGNSFLSTAANTISGNANSAIIVGSDSTGHDILANRIGFGADGLTLLGNGPGSAVQISADFTTITANSFGGNGGGIFIGAGVNDTVVQSNLIGLPGASNSGAGVSIFGGNNNLIGGPVPNLGNVIAGNGGAGVQVVGLQGGGTGNSILLNEIYGNDGLGIDLELGGNNDQPAPVLTGASNTAVVGTLTAAPSTIFHLEFFANTLCDPSGSGEGEFPIGELNDSTDAGGLLNFNAPVSGGGGRPFVTATATDQLGNTSEFSNCILNPAAVAPAPAPALGIVPLGLALLLLTAIGWLALGSAARGRRSAVARRQPFDGAQDRPR